MVKYARFAALCALIALPVAAQDARSVVARVGSTDITLGHAIALRAQLPAQFAQVPDATLFPAIVDQLIEQELLAQSQRGALSLRNRTMLENETRSFLASVALTAEIAVVMTEESIATAYASFVEAYGAGEPVIEHRAAHILVRSEEELAAVTEALEQGQAFADVARTFSIDGSSRQGGDLGWFAAGVMIPEFQAAVEALEPGQVSEPLQTRFGFHVITLLDRRTANVPSLDEIREDLVAEIQRDATATLIRGLRERGSIQSFAESFDPALLSQSSLLDD